MRVLNVHQRGLQASRDKVGALIDSLATPADVLWPKQSWPRMELDRPLALGAAGGHGPIRYVVESYAPGESIRFRLTGPRGFDGFHGYEVVQSPGSRVMLRHTLQITTHGLAVASWLLVYRPLHDALIEDSLATAEAALGQPPRLERWSPWVRLLRWALTGGKARPQVMPDTRLQRKLLSAGRLSG